MLHADVDEIRRAIPLFLESGSTIELRAPKSNEGTISGYFSDPAKLERAAAAANSRAPGIYITINPVSADVLARADNRLKARASVTTTDREITRRRLLLLDFDPARPAGISSTDAEHAAAIAAARSACEALIALGWAPPVLADSGNGAHLLFRIDLPNDAAATELVKSVLRSAAKRFDTAAVTVDLSVFNAARISKLYGTVSRKGDSTIERPHRISRLLELPESFVPVAIETLREFAAQGAPDPRKATTHAPSRPGPRLVSDFSLERFIAEHGIGIARSPDVHEGSERWVLDHCPFNPDHRAPDATLFRRVSDGRLGFKCLHNSCSDRGWKEFREFYEPDRPRGRRRDSGHQHRPPSSATADICDEIPVSAADVEAAAEAAIAADDLVAAVALAPNIGSLKAMIRVVVLAKLRQHFKRRWPASDIQRAMKEAAAANAEPPPEDGLEDEAGQPPDGPDLLPYPLTDAGNGERIAAMFGGEIRYCVEMKRWLVWDGIRWGVDELNVMRQKAKAMARLLHRQGKDRGEDKFQVHARATESYAGISAALGSAATESGIPISAAELDQHPYLLNCPNGVVDLRDGTLLRHNRDFLITKLCPVPYQANAPCDRFLGFLQWAMGANPEAELSDRAARLVGFLQRAFGYALTSDVSEKAVFILHGERGNNGKTTLLTTFRDLLGRDYSGQLVIDTVMSMKNQDATTRADLADLRGVRLVVTSEVEKEHKLNEGKIKYITAGMGSIKSCRKYENPIEFTATHKLFMDCNHRPVVRGVDDAIWRRLKLIPFEVTVTEEEKDLQLPAKLRAEFPGILAWAVRGCIAWLKEGLGDPPEVSSAGQEWREHDDPLKEFLDDCCEKGDELFIRASDLAAGYDHWAKQARERYPLGREAFNERLQAKGFKQSRSRRIDGKQTRTWEGIELRAEIAAALRNKGAAPAWLRED
jgi:P4 family phage/plasmid primase-like protien